MTSPRDPDRLIRTYLEDGPTELPRDSYEALDERITRTPQRAGFGPWRDSRMVTLSRAMFGVAAVLLVAVALILVSGPGSTGPAPSATPLTPSSSAVAGPLVYRWVGELEPGHYATSLSWDDSLVFEFTVGEGWEARDINIRKGDHTSLAFFPIENVATDACTRKLGDPPMSEADVIEALGRIATIEGRPTRARVGDRDATSVEFTVEPPDGCVASAFGLIKLPEQRSCPPEACSGLGGEWLGLEFGTLTHHHRLWVMTVGRRLVAIDAIWTDEATPSELQALEEVIDSVRLETPLATPAPSASG